MRTLIALALAAALPSAAAVVCDAGTACGTSQDNFQCSGALSCDEAVLFCDPSRCHMDCTGQGSCKQSHLQCVSGYCHLRCAREQSCQQMKTYADLEIQTNFNIDPIGRDYGIWMAAMSSEGKLICDGDQSCQQTAIGCASDKCELVCNGQQACEQAGYDVKSSSEGALVRCTNRQSCQQASFDFEDIGGDAELVCDNQLGCTQATVVCPSRHSLVVRCNGVKSCEQMTLRAPSTMLPGQRCHLECVGQLACSGIDQSRVTGGVTATCSSGAGCPGFLLNTTPAPTQPGVLVPALLKMLFRLTLAILLTLFDNAAFLQALLGLLGSLVTGLQVHWTCPASACTAGCPASAALKIDSGCLATVGTTARLADLLAGGASGGTVVEVGASYSSTGSQEAVRRVLQQEQDVPTTLQGFGLTDVEVAESEVLEQSRSTDDDGLKTGHVILVVVICVAALATVAIAVYCCKRRAKPVSASTSPDKHNTDVSV